MKIKREARVSSQKKRCEDRSRDWCKGGVVRPLAKVCGQPREAEKVRMDSPPELSEESSPASIWTFNPPRLLSDFQPPEMKDTKFVPF